MKDVTTIEKRYGVSNSMSGYTEYLSATKIDQAEFGSRIEEQINQYPSSGGISIQHIVHFAQDLYWESVSEGHKRTLVVSTIDCSRQLMFEIPFVFDPNVSIDNCHRHFRFGYNRLIVIEKN